MTKLAVLFDLDDTLLWDQRSVKEAFHATCKIAEARVGIDPDALEAAVRREARALYEGYETFSFTQNIGINPFEGLWANFTEGEQPEFRKLQELAPGYRRNAWIKALQSVGVNDDALGAELAEQFPAERRARPFVYEETFRILETLKQSVKLLLLTNGSPDLQREKLAGVSRLAPYFDHIVISGEFGQGKPAAAIFEHALELLEVTPDQAVMVGDKLSTDIKGANGIGLDSVWINRTGMEADSSIATPTYEITHLDDLLGIVGLA